MRSASGNAALIILLLLVAAFVIVAMHEQEFRGVPSFASQKRDRESDSPGIIDSILSTFRGSTSESSESPMRARMKDDVYEETPSSKTATKKKVANKPATRVVPKQHDDLGRRDRAELNELLEKVDP